MNSLVIRRTTTADAAQMAAIYGDTLVIHGTLQLPMPSSEIWQQRLAAHNADQHSLIAELGGQAVGHIMLYRAGNVRRQHVGSFGMAVRDAHQGQGIGSALLLAATDLADNWLNLRRLELTVFTDNQAAIALYKKFGFQIEGESKDYAFRNGDYVDVLHMARLNR